MARTLRAAARYDGKDKIIEEGRDHPKNYKIFNNGTFKGIEINPVEL
jgi:hypothetical protein